MSKHKTIIFTLNNKKVLVWEVEDAKLVQNLFNMQLTLGATNWKSADNEFNE